MLEQIQVCFLLFSIYSFLGWLMEVVNTLRVEKKFVNRGFLVGPFCPIYGFGVLLMTMLLEKYQDDLVATFIFAILICGILEYFTSYFLEKIFHARWWDYSNRKFNINGRICLENLFVFGILGCLIMYKLNPFLITLLNKIPNICLTLISILMFICFTVDALISGKIIYKLKEATNNFKKDNTEEISIKVKKILSTRLVFQERLLSAFPNLKKSINLEEIIESGRDKMQKIKEKIKQIKQE